MFCSRTKLPLYRNGNVWVTQEMQRNVLSFFRNDMPTFVMDDVMVMSQIGVLLGSQLNSSVADMVDMQMQAIRINSL